MFSESGQSDISLVRLHPGTFNYIDSVMQHGGYVGGATDITMERWSLGIAATWYLIMLPLWLYGIDGGVWFFRPPLSSILPGNGTNKGTGTCSPT